MSAIPVYNQLVKVNKEITAKQNILAVLRAANTGWGNISAEMFNLSNVIEWSGEDKTKPFQVRHPNGNTIDYKTTDKMMITGNSKRGLSGTVDIFYNRVNLNDFNEAPDIIGTADRPIILSGNAGIISQYNQLQTYSNQKADPNNKLTLERFKTAEVGTQLNRASQVGFTSIDSNVLITLFSILMWHFNLHPDLVYLRLVNFNSSTNVFTFVCEPYSDERLGNYIYKNSFTTYVKI